MKAQAQKDFVLQAAFRAVRNPNALGNPVYFWGPRHSGKTRLLQRVARLARRRGKSVFIFSCKEFKFNFRQKLRFHGLRAWEKELSTVDFFILNALDEISNCPRTQQFLLSVWNHRVLTELPILVGAKVAPQELFVNSHLQNRCLAGFSISLGPNKQSQTLQEIVNQVLEKFHISLQTLQSQASQKAATSRAAFVALAMDAGFSSRELAQALGGRSIASIRQANRRSQELLSTDPSFRATIELIAKDIPLEG